MSKNSNAGGKIVSQVSRKNKYMVEDQQNFTWEQLENIPRGCFKRGLLYYCHPIRRDNWIFFLLKAQRYYQKNKCFTRVLLAKQERWKLSDDKGAKGGHNSAFPLCKSRSFLFWSQILKY